MKTEYTVQEILDMDFMILQKDTSSKGNSPETTEFFNRKFTLVIPKAKESE